MLAHTLTSYPCCFIPVQLRPLRYDDFKNAMTVIRPSLQKSKWDELENWNEEFGSS
jgi:spastin